MRRTISAVIICLLVLLYAPASFAQEQTFTYQPQGVFVNTLEDGRLQVGALFLVRNDSDVPLYFEAFHTPVLDREGNTLTTAVMESCMPRFIMPGKLAFVWCMSRAEEIKPEQLSSAAPPQAECFGFPQSIDASEDLAVSGEKCEVITREDGKPTLRISATVTNKGNRECMGSGGFFLIEGVGDDRPSFPVAFGNDAFLGKLAPGESVEVGAELDEMKIYIMQLLGYQSYDPEVFHYTAHAFASRLK